LKENFSPPSWLINNFPKYSFELVSLPMEAHELTTAITRV